MKFLVLKKKLDRALFSMWQEKVSWKHWSQGGIIKLILSPVLAFSLSVSFCQCCQLSLGMIPIFLFHSFVSKMAAALIAVKQAVLHQSCQSKASCYASKAACNANTVFCQTDRVPCTTDTRLPLLCFVSQSFCWFMPCSLPLRFVPSCSSSLCLLLCCLINCFP